jgi:hypothetical protein
MDEGFYESFDYLKKYHPHLVPKYEEIKQKTR